MFVKPVPAKDPIIELEIPEGYGFVTTGTVYVRKSKAIFHLWSSVLGKLVTVTPNGVKED
jgi:hypothetical protein